MTAVKEWVKENKPSEFFASWEKDSSYKDDSVEYFLNNIHFNSFSVNIINLILLLSANSVAAFHLA